MPKHFSVKEAGLPVPALSGAATSRLGPEMKSTGEVMGIDRGSRSGLCQIADGCAAAACQNRQRFHQRQRCRQRTRSSRWRAILSRSGSESSRPAEPHDIGAAKPRIAGNARLQDSRRTSARPRPSQERRHQFHHQHARAEKFRAKTSHVIRNAAIAQKIPIMTTLRAAQAGVYGIRSLQK